MGAVAGLGIHELVIRPRAPSDGKAISQIAWPHDCVIATLRRGRRRVIPRGDTLLQAGDVLAVVAEDDASATVRTYCEGDD